MWRLCVYSILYFLAVSVLWLIHGFIHSAPENWGLSPEILVPTLVSPDIAHVVSVCMFMVAVALFPQSAVLAEEGQSPRAETPSTVTEVDMDLDSYQIALEEVLTWLLSAEDTFQEQDDISDDVEEVKEQFATHEVNICGREPYFSRAGPDF